MKAVTGYLKRTPQGKTHRWVEMMNERGRLRTWCGLEAPVVAVYVPKYEYPPSCSKCRGALRESEERKR